MPRLGWFRVQGLGASGLKVLLLESSWIQGLEAWGVQGFWGLGASGLWVQL